MQEFLLGAGLALMVTIIAWSDQFKSLKKDTINAENLLLGARNVNWRIIRQILNNKNKKTSDILNELNDIFKKDTDDNIKDLDIVLYFRKLDRKSLLLKTLYKWKYYSIIFLSLVFLFGGVITFFIDEEKYCTILKAQLPHNIIPTLITILVTILILIYVLIINYIETKYRDDFFNLIDLI